MTGKIVRTILYRRKREKKTSYNVRRKLLMSPKPRLVVRKSLKNIWLQIVQYNKKGDKVIASAHSRELIKFGWKGSRKNIPACYCTGLLIAKKAKAKNIREVVPDLGIYRVIHGSKLFAALTGAVDASLMVSMDKDVAPKAERILGKHIQNLKVNLDEIKKRILG